MRPSSRYADGPIAAACQSGRLKLNSALAGAGAWWAQSARRTLESCTASGYRQVTTGQCAAVMTR